MDVDTVSPIRSPPPSVVIFCSIYCNTIFHFLALDLDLLSLSVCLPFASIHPVPKQKTTRSGKMCRCHFEKVQTLGIISTFDWVPMG